MLGIEKFQFELGKDKKEYFKVNIFKLYIYIYTQVIWYATVNRHGLLHFQFLPVNFMTSFCDDVSS